MKSILLFTVLFCINISFSQSTTEKYNSLMERYEYFDNNGTMIGYKKYNSLMEQWEYYPLNSKTNTNSRYTNSDYIDPYKGTNDLIYKGLEMKQNKYDYNRKLIADKIYNISEFFNIFYNNQQIPKISQKMGTVNQLYKSFNDGIAQINAMNADLSNTSTTNEILNWLEQFNTRLNAISQEIINSK